MPASLLSPIAARRPAAARCGLRLRPRWSTLVASLSLALCLPFAAGAEEPAADLTALPLERLLDIEITSASRFPQKVSEAASAVTVVTAADIRGLGFRTLADILRSIPGLYVFGDRAYGYVGVRGFSRLGDYNSRVLLLLDGNRLNDSVYDQAFLGNEFPLDVDLIERVEFVPGPGSAVYGANALFGVVNVITRRGAEMNGVELAGAYGSESSGRLRASFGRRWNEGAELLLSASGMRYGGQDLYFPEFDQPPSSDGIARGLDDERGESFFLKFGYGRFWATLLQGERTQGIATAAWGQVFGDPRSNVKDRQTLGDLGYVAGLGDGLELTGRLFFGRYDYTGHYVLDYPPVTLNRDTGIGQWWGAEARLYVTRFEGHKLVAGLEYQRAGRRDQSNVDVDPPGATYLDDHRTAQRVSLYAEDQVRLSDRWSASLGLRGDWLSDAGTRVSPRLSVNYRGERDWVLKYVYGSAFRPPNAYEAFYTSPGDGGTKVNPGLGAETVRGQELIFEKHFGPRARLTATAFDNSVRNLITLGQDPSDGMLVFGNTGSVEAYGGVLVFDHLWENGARAWASYSAQRTRDSLTGTRALNTPPQLARAAWLGPLFRTPLQLGVEAIYVGERTGANGTAPGYAIANLTLLARVNRHLDISASVYNLFDRRYEDPVSAEFVQRTLVQDGRTARLKAVLRF